MADLKFTANTSEASKKIDLLQKQIDKLEIDIAKNKEINFDTRVAEAKIKGLKNAISSIMKDIAKETQQQALGTKDLLHTDENIRKLKNLSSQITSLYKEIANTGGTKTQIAELNRLNASFNGTLSAIKRVGTEQQKQEADAIRNHKNTINRITDEKNAIEQVAKADSQRMNAANKSMTEYQKLINEYISLLKKAENAKNNTTSKNALKPSEEQYMYGYPDGTAGRFDQIQARLKEIRDTYGDIPAIQAQIAQMDDHMANQIGYQQRLAREKSEFQQIIDLQKQAYNVEQKMQQLVSAPKKNKNMINELKQEHQELMKQYDAWKSVTNITETESKLLKEQAQNFQRISNQAQAHAKDMSSLNKSYDKFSATVGNIFKYIITYQLYNRMVEGVQNAIQIMKDLDAAFTDIQMVTMGTEEETYQLSLQYNDLAKEMGATTQEIAEGATEWLRQGKTAEETTELLRASMTLSKVGAIESSQATELLTSSLNGYKIAAQDAMSVVDKISSIDLAAATSSEELAVALSRTANSAADAEVSLDKLLGMIGTVSSVTRKSASTIGESFKTIFARMSNVAAGKDTDDEGESLNDVEKTLNSLGITLRKSQYEWRSFEDVLDEVAEKWDVFSDTEQSKIATAIAGVRQQENFRALMNNWDSVKDLTAVAENSMGSASEKMEIYLDSVEAKTKEVQAAWEEFILKLNQSDSYKGALDVVIFLIENLPTVATLIMSILVAWKSWSAYSKIADQISAATALMTIKTQTQAMADNLATIAKQSHTSAIQANTAATQLNSQATSENQISGQANLLTDQSQAQGKQAETLAIEANTAALEANTLAEKNNQVAGQMSLFSDNSQAVALQGQQLSLFKKNITGATTLTGTFTKAVEKNTTSLVNGASGVSKFTSLLGKFSMGIGIVSTAISLASTAVMAYNGYLDGLKESVSETAQTIDALQSEVDDIDNIKQKYDEIIKTSGSAAEQKENLIALQDELKQKYGEEADAIDLVNGRYETQIEILKNLQKARLEEQVSEYNQGADERNKLLNTNTSTSIGDFDRNSEAGKLLMETAQKYVNSPLGVRVKTQSNGIWGAEDVLDISATGEELVRIYDELQEKSKNLSKDQQELLGKYLNSSNWVTKSMKEDYDRFSEAVSEKDRGRLIEFENNNWNEMVAFQDSLKERKSLYEEYSKSENTAEKERLLNQLEEQTKIVLDAKEKLYKKAGNDSELIGLLDDFFEEYDIGSLFKTDPTAFSYFDDLIKKTSETNKAAGDNIKAFSNQLDILDRQFETGQINATQYFDGINKQIDSIDLNKIDAMYGSMKNFNTMLTSMAANTTNYVQTLMDSFASGNMDDFEFFDNLTAVVSNLDKITSTIDEANNKNLFDKNGQNNDIVDNALNDKSHKETRLTKEAQNIVDEMSSQNVLIPEESVEKAKELNKELKNLQKTGKDVEEVDVIDEKGLKTETEELKDSIKEIQDMDFKGLDQAYETLNQAFEDGRLSNNVETTLGQVDNNLRDSAMKMASFLKEQVNSSNESYQTAAKNALDAMGLMATASEEEIATAIINTNTNLNAAANAGNKIAATAMGKTIQNLGQMLIKLADAMDGFEMTIPIKIPAIRLNTSLTDIASGGSLIKIDDKATQETEIKIGAAGTIRSIGEMLSNADIADSIGNMFTPIEAPIKKSGGTNGTSGGYSPSGGGSKSGSGSDYSAEDAASDLADILDDIEDYEADIELDLEDQTEQLINHYNLEKNKLESLKEELDYYEGIYDSVENTTKWLETQSKLLENQSNMVEELQKSNDKIDKQRQKIYSENSGYNVLGWFDSEGNDTLAYGDLINSFEYQKNAIQKETAAQMRDVYNSVAGSTSEDAIENAKDRIEELQKAADKRLEALDKEREKVENIHDSVSELNDAWDENQEAIRDALADMHDRIIDMRDTLVDQMMEQLEKAVDKQNESIEKDVTRMEQLVSIREKYYDILNETIDTQAELDSELQSSLDSFEYLDEQMRQLMFNEEDYKVLSETLTGIQEDIADIWEDHYAQIDSLTDDEMYKAEYITAETERQLEMKMQEYELAKAELDVAKARTNLQNVQNERNVRMFVNGQWTWVADPDAVKDAQQQLADAEREKNRIEREAEQQRLIDSMDKIIDSDNLQIDENNELLERVQEAIELQTQEVQSIEQALENIANTDLPAVGDVLQGAFGADGKSGWISELLQNINKSTSGLTLALKGYTVASAENALKNGSLSKSEFNDLVSKLGYSFNETTGIVTTPEGSFSAHYKGWTQKNNNDVQLGTANNGVQVTGGGSNANGSGGGSGASGFPRSGHVSTSSLPLRIRSGAGTNYKVLGLMPKGAAVTITGEANSGWAKVQYNGINGYASRQYLTYDQGGVAIGKGMFLKDVNVPERILSPKQTKSFDYLVKNLTTNPVLAALTKNPNVTSNLNGLGGAIGETKQYYFSNFTVQADNLTEFIDSLDAMIPISRK